MTVTDTVVVRYHAPEWTAYRYCSRVITIIPPKKGIDCAITSTIVPDTLKVHWQLHNTGQAPVTLTNARITADASLGTLLDPATRPMTDLGPLSTASFPGTSSFAGLRTRVRDISSSKRWTSRRS